MTLGERITELRESRGWNQKELASRSGVHPSVISLMERNSRNGARPETLRKLADALEVPVGYLLGDETSYPMGKSASTGMVRESASPYQSDLEPYRQAIELAKGFNLSPDDLKRLIETAGAMFTKA